jgi:hypothetical protein
VTGECTTTTTGLESLLDFFFGTSAAANGFDEYGHYLRTFGLVTTCTTITVQVLGECNARFGTADELTSSSTVPDEPDSRDHKRSSKPRTGSGAVTGGREQDVPTPPPAQPVPEPEPEPQPAAARDEAGTGDELRPAPEATSNRRALRAGRELLRFLMEDH